MSLHLINSPAFQSQYNMDLYCTDAFKLPFDEYVDFTKAMIKKARQSAELPFDDTVIKMNQPFELNSGKAHYKHSVLLIHGFLASPYIMHALSKFYESKGFLVRCILLPGHGTCPGDLLNANSKHWIKSVQYGIQSLQKISDNIHICAYSLGASLAMNILKDFDIASLAFFSPAFKITPAAKAASIASQLSSYFELPYLSWPALSQDVDNATYRSFPMVSVSEVQNAIASISKKSKSISSTLPCFYVISKQDVTVSAIACINNFKKNIDHNSHLMIYSSKKMEVINNRTEIIRSDLIENNILDISHISVPVSPKDPHYGKDSFFEPPDATHPNIQLGEMSPMNKKRKNFKRLTFNPNFDHMIKQLGRFYKKQGLIH